MSEGTEDFAERLLAWYDRHARTLPWRVPPGDATRADPYHVLVSEIMLQQTTVAVVLKRFPEFIDRFPDVFALAEAPETDVLAAWAGLGYYRRARSLHACAKVVAGELDGVFPQTEKELKALPGVGDYTAAAIAAIAFGEPAVVVDGNIERIVTRLYCIAAPLPGAKKQVKARTGDLTPRSRPGDFAQAMMDLGAGICRPKGPDCLLCPVRVHCLAASAGTQENYPVKAPKKEKKTVSGQMFVCMNARGQVLCVDRPGSGLFAGMLGLPGDGWDGGSDVLEPSGDPAGEIEHVLTHRRLKIRVYRCAVADAPEGGRWLPLEEARAAMPTLFVKALDVALDPQEGRLRMA